MLFYQHYSSRAQKLFQLRDYNSAIQITNGITEISVMRLKHLKEVSSNLCDVYVITDSLQSLSVKWIERFGKIREAFDPTSSFQNYRNLPKDPPCIPFVGA